MYASAGRAGGGAGRTDCGAGGRTDGVAARGAGAARRGAGAAGRTEGAALRVGGLGGARLAWETGCSSKPAITRNGCHWLMPACQTWVSESTMDNRNRSSNCSSETTLTSSDANWTCHFSSSAIGGGLLTDQSSQLTASALMRSNLAAGCCFREPLLPQ